MSDFVRSPKVDTLAFLAPQGQPPLAIEDLPQYADLLHVTAAPPFFETTAQVLNGGLTPDGKRQLPGIDRFRQLIDSQQQLSLVLEGQDIVAARESGKTGIIFGLQQAPQDSDKKKIQEIFNAGVRVMALEYKNGRRRFGSGWLDREGGLTADGRKLIDTMAECGLILDLSHSGEQTAADAIDHILVHELPIEVMASHGGVYEGYDGDVNHINNRRNLSENRLGEIALGLNGLVGIYNLTFGLSGHDDSPVPFYSQLHRAVVWFPDHTAVGSDATYQSRGLEEWEGTSRFLMNNIAAGTDMVPRHPDTSLELNTPDRLRIIGENLVAGGMTSDQAAKVIGINALRFFERALPATT